MKIHSLLIAVTLMVSALTSHCQFIAPFEEWTPANDYDTNAVYNIEDSWPSVPFSVTTPTSPSPSVSFQGLDDDTTSIPPDTNGAVGPNHVVTMLNSQVRILDRTGVTNYLTTSLFNWWTNAGTIQNVYDPRILYDPYNDRWIAAAGANGNQHATNSAVLVAVSQGSDPTGGWYFRKIQSDPNHVLWADFTMLGFNKNWIAVSFNMFTNGGGGSHCRIYLFDKTNFFNNGTNYAVINNPQSLGSTIVPAITYDNSISSLYCVNISNPRYTNTSGILSGAIRLHTISGSVGSPSLAAGPLAETSAWSHSAGGVNLAPQTNSAVKFYNNDGRIQRVVYRNGSIWTTHTIFQPSTSPTHTGIQWWQLTTDGAIQQVGRIEDQAGINFYAYPSIAVNRFNDALIGYTTFSTNRYASAGYAFRAFSDAPNKFRSNITLKEGLGVYYKTFGGSLNRWGDFSVTVVDPANDTDFWTIQEYAATPSGSGNSDGDGRWGVWWGKIVASMPANDNFANAIVLTNYQGNTNGTLFRATKESGEPNHAGATGGRSIWYKWTPSVTAYANFDTTLSASGIDTVLAVYTGAAVNSLTLVTSNDDFRATPRSLVTFYAVSGTAYYIAIDAKSSSTEGGDGIVLSWSQPIIPEFSLQPADLHILAGDTLILPSLAIGQPTPTYQWRLDGANISGATYAYYTNSSIATNQGGAYTVVASNTYASRTSIVATVTVHPSATATMDSFEYLSGDKFKFTVTGVPGYNYVVQATTDFTNWVSLNTNTSSFSFTNDVSTNYPYRFFRSIY